jgi:parallel beta-helix repeat protein
VRITNSSFGNVITGNTIVGNREGMQLLFYAPDNLIVGNTISSNWYRGVSIGGCPGNRIIGNIVTNNTEIAIDIADSEHVEILDNTISNNPSTAIFFGGSSRANVVEGNTIVGNINSIGFWSNSSSNIIYHNNFVNNEHQAPGTLPPGMEALNVWDNGAEGNYWSDYTGVDSNHDGIGDAMHVMDANNTDRYPLMGMFSDFNATLEHHVQIVCNSSLSNFVFNGTVITFDVAGKDNTTGFCRICIPTGLINETYRIFVNRTEVQYSTLSCSNTTHKYLYVSYTHPEKVLIINDDWYKANALVCDVNRDMKVDVKDLVTAIASFGSHSGEPKWNPHSDVTGDGTVNIIDFATIIKHFGEHYP